MAKDFLKILQEVRGTGQPGIPYTDGIYWELTVALHNGNPGIYGDILAIYADIQGVIIDLDDFEIKYADFLVKYTDFLTKYSDVLTIYADIQTIQADVTIKRDEAITAADSILNLTTTSEQIDTVLPIDVNYDSLTGNMHFKIPKGKAAEVSVNATNTLAPGAAATVVDNNPGDTNVADLVFGIPEGVKGDNFTILAQITVAQVEAIVAPTLAEAYQVTDNGTINGLAFQALEIAYWNGISWLNLGGLGGAGGGFQTRGSMTLNANADTGTVHDDVYGDVFVDATGFVGANPGIPDSSVYIVDAAAANNTITGGSISYVGGETLAILEAAANPWFNITSAVNSFNGRVGDIIPMVGDYDKSLVGLGNVDDTSDLAKPLSNASTAALALKVGKTSDIASAQMPTGTTAERDVTGIPGSFRFNSERNQFEGYGNVAWGPVGGTPDATGKLGYELGTDGTGINDSKWSPFRTTPNTVSEDFTLLTGTNASIVSPTIADGVTLTIEAGSTLVIL